MRADFRERRAENDDWRVAADAFLIYVFRIRVNAPRGVVLFAIVGKLLLSQTQDVVMIQVLSNGV
jgi:hypothetical protein